jgi:rhodanese-related sulfurtransferase
MNLQDLIKTSNYTLIDVREPIELEMDGALVGAINIPLGEIDERLQEIKKITNPTIIFCRSGGRSGNAVQFLISQGLTDVINGGGFGFLGSIIENCKI